MKNRCSCIMGLFTMFLLQACLISCRDNETEDNGQQEMKVLVMSSDGGKISFPVSSDAHISYIEDEKSLVYKECEANDSVLLETVGYNYLKAYIKRDSLFVEIGKNRELQKQHLMVSYREFNADKNLDITLDKADSCIIDSVKYLEKLSASSSLEMQTFKINLNGDNSQLIMYPLSQTSGRLTFDNAKDIEALLPLGLDSKINVPSINGLDSTNRVFAPSVSIPVTDDYWKSSPLVISDKSYLVSDSVSVYVEYIKEKVKTDVIIKDLNKGTFQHIFGIATLRYPSGYWKTER